MSPLNRRIEDGPEAIALDSLERLGPELRRKVNEVVLGQSPHLVGGREGWGRPVLKMIIPHQENRHLPFRGTRLANRVTAGTSSSPLQNTARSWETVAS